MGSDKLNSKRVKPRYATHADDHFIVQPIASFSIRAEASKIVLLLKVRVPVPEIWMCTNKADA